MTQDEPRTNKVILVTGASAGIGAAVAREASRLGYPLALTARRQDRLEGLAAELAGTDGRVIVIAAALEDTGAPEHIVSEVIARFRRLDVVINNAGMGLPNLFAESDPDQIRRQLDVNLVAPLLLTRHALPYLIERRGVIINVGSAITALPNPSLGAYGTTKAALAYWSTALRRELRHTGVSVCLVEPGPVKTEFFEALSSLSDRYHPMLDAPASWMSADVNEVARRIARLIERPKRRLSVRRRFVWPWRLFGAIFQACPPLGDIAVSSVVRHYDGVDPRTNVRSSAQKQPSRTNST